MNHLSIRNALVELIDGIEFTRKPKVDVLLPESAFSQKNLPMIIVETPKLESTELWDSEHIRETYSVDIHFIDAHKASPQGEQETINYLQWLRSRTLVAIMNTDYLNLPQLHIHTSFLSYELTNEIEEFEGANLVKVMCSITVPVIYNTNTQWVFQDGYGYGYGYSTEQNLDYYQLLGE